MKTSPEEIKPKLGILIWMDFVQAKTAIYQDETTAAIKSSLEKMEAAITPP
jgi:hypothetical protein